MSTTIHDAFLLEATDYAKVDSVMQRLRRGLEPLAQELVLKEIARLAVEILDEFRLNIIRPPSSETALDMAVDKFFMEVEETRKKGTRNPSSDMEFTLSLHLHQGRFYVILFTEQQAFLDHFKKTVACRDFSYWNNTDEPKGVSRKEWLARKRTWDKILSHTSAPAMNGAVFTIVRPVAYLADNWRDRIKSLFPLEGLSYEQRVERSAREQALESHLDKIGFNAKTCTRLSDYIHLRSDFLGKIKDGDEEALCLYRQAETHVRGCLFEAPQNHISDHFGDILKGE